MRAVKPRHPGTLHAAVLGAVEELGLDRAAHETIRSTGWLYDATDDSRSPTRRDCLTDESLDGRQAARPLYEDARELSRAGATALAIDLATLAGGAFLPIAVDTDLAAAHAAVANFSLQSGEAISETVQCVADGKLCPADARKALPLIDDALRALMALRAVVVAASDQAHRP